MQTYWLIITEIWQAWDTLLRIPLFAGIMAIIGGQICVFISGKIKGAPDNSQWPYKTWRPISGSAILVTLICMIVVIAYSFAVMLVSEWLMLRVIWSESEILLRIISAIIALLVVSVGFVATLIIIGNLSLVPFGGIPLSVGTANEPYDRLPDSLPAYAVVLLLLIIILIQLAALLIPFALLFLFV